ncbi:prephenate dehydratase [Aerococcus urinaeequi]|uniref:Prephenate dehydratase n=1 Tax=Aerococcus urinaeequi TaxID=51665 RepID=A0AAC9A6N7_9LACT|nr:prephenate dehydratase domain-containing protein [Aerococcus urinaeequi]AMB97412.1 prephenate dehydratase [Aerococcus urinaeequi]
MMRIGYQGIPGAYSEAATIAFVNEQLHVEIDDERLEIISYDDFQPMVDDLVAEKVDRIVMPIENSTTGLIARTMDIIRYQPVLAKYEHYQPVNHVLWGLPGADIQKVEKVYSHPEALSQCKLLFDRYPNMDPVAYIDTAVSAEFIVQENDLTIAAIASPRAGELHGLQALEPAAYDEAGNMTRFLVFERYDHIDMTNNHDKLMLYIETPHEPGALAKLLQVLDVYRINLEGLNARPIPMKPFRYGFFIEADPSNMIGDLEALEKILKALSTHIQVVAQFKQNR